MENAESKNITFAKLQRRLKLNKRLSNYNYTGERTFVVVSGMNSDTFNISKVKGLRFYEERMLFFLFLLRYKKTNIIYITSKNFNTKLFDYYLKLISNNSKQFEDLKKRLVHIEVDDISNHNKTLALTQKILKSPKTIANILEHINNPKKAVLRCYNPTEDERELAIKLGIPLFSSREKFDYVGTKSGSRKVFRLAGLNLIPGYSYLKNFDELCLAMAKLILSHPTEEKLVVKLNSSASGRGNSIFLSRKFLNEEDIRLSKQVKPELLARKIKLLFKKYISLQSADQKLNDYINAFNRVGGITELFVSGDIQSSPSVQVSISAEGIPKVISTHEQILGGKDKQKYLGCSFPSNIAYRNLIVREATKAAKWMSQKGMVGHFGIDFVVIKNLEGNYDVFPIEINMRKGGTTHPFRIASYLTKSKYYRRRGELISKNEPIHYIAMDLIESEMYKGIKPMDLLKLVTSSEINFNKTSNKGALIYMPDMVKTYGRFGAICIGHSDKEANTIYKQLVKLIDKNRNNMLF